MNDVLRSPVTRRTAMLLPAALPLAARAVSGAAAEPSPCLSAQNSPATPGVAGLTVSCTAGRALPFDPKLFGTVGVYDVDWLLQPRFQALLDHLAASPGAFTTLRFFGIFTAGQLDQLQPDGVGTVWPDPAAPIDWTIPLDALATLTRRGITPFISLGFFPGAVSPSPIAPPASLGRWQMLVRAFLQTVADDPRFGPDAIADWWFEVWNEPNEGRFWSGTIDDYFALYRATAETVRETGLPVRLGGPAIAWKPQEDPRMGAPWMEQFFRFLAANPDVACDFISIHRKGTVASDPPDPRRIPDAFVTTAEQVLAIIPERAEGLVIVNDEADEKVGFEVPYQPRMDEHNAAWLASATTASAGLTARYHDAGLRFVTMPDNADLQLVQAPFDGRRSIMTITSAAATDDLLKLAPYGFYEMVRLLGDHQLVPIVSTLPTGISALATGDETSVTLLLTSYPAPDGPVPGPREISLSLRDIPWHRVNIARYLIDHDHGNAWAAAGGSNADPFPRPAAGRIAAIRLAQELPLAEPARHDVVIDAGRWDTSVRLAPFATTVIQIAPFRPDVPERPAWVTAERRNGNVALRWEPPGGRGFGTFEVWRAIGGAPTVRVSPETLRSAIWTETAPPPVVRQWAVRAISVSGVPGPFGITPELR